MRLRAGPSADHATAEEVFQDVGVAVRREAARGTDPADATSWMRIGDRVRAQLAIDGSAIITLSV